MGLLSAVAISALMWNGYNVLQQYRTASRLALNSELADKSLLFTTELAIERGLTYTLLASSDAPQPEALLHLEEQRKRVDKRFHAFLRILNTHYMPDTTEALPQGFRIFQRHNLQLDRLRNEIDSVFEKQVKKDISMQWFGLVTWIIEDVSRLQREIMTSTHEAGYVIAQGQQLRSLFFRMTETAGLERALIAQKIALKRRLNDDDLNQIADFQEVHNNGHLQLLELIKEYPDTGELGLAMASYKAVFRDSYKRLRRTVIDASARGVSYPLSALDWFSEATKAIDTIIKLSEAFTHHHRSDVAVIQRQANNTVFTMAGTVVLVLLLFTFAYLITYRRILIPLQILDQAAKTIQQGDLGREVSLRASDEFGRLGQSFESMRQSLLADREQRDKAEQELRKLHQAVEQSISSLVITDAQGVTEYVNHRFELTTGYSPEEVIGKKYNIVRSGHTPTKVYQDLWDTITSGDVWEGELLNRKKSGELFWELVSISPVSNKQDEITHFIGMHYDITQRKHMEEKLNYLAYHDEMTGLPNRTLLADRFQQLTSQSKRRSVQFALLMLDLNRFKLINDSLGHETGDQVLVEVGDRLLQLARSEDTVARYGGDEFVLLVTDIESATDITEIAHRINRKVSEPLYIEERTLHIGCSIGVAIWPQDGETLDNLLSNADAAMYQAKTRSGDKLQFFTDELNAKVQQRMEMENDLREALTRNELELYYQPQFNLQDECITGIEALLRWNHLDGMVMPDRFIPLAEETGLILPIGEWVLDQACQQVVQLEQLGYPDLSVSINVSVRQLEGQDIVSVFKQLIKRTGISPSSLEIEITESVMMDDPETMIESLAKLKSLGVKLALDDFGTGHSSLSYLQRFPFDRLKIDRAFVRNITANSDDAAIAITIGAMAKSLNLEVIAEGVEDEDQMDFLLECGCNHIQGYIISKPVPASELVAVLKKFKSCAKDKHHITT